MWIYGFRLLSPWLVSAILGASEGGRGVLFSTVDVEGLSHKVSETRVSTQRISIYSRNDFQFWSSTGFEVEQNSLGLSGNHN